MNVGVLFFVFLFFLQRRTDIGRHLQVVGAEIGVTTGRKRRCGWLDVPVIQYGHMINNYQSINLTKLDVLDDLDEGEWAWCYAGDTEYRYFDTV